MAKQNNDMPDSDYIPGAAFGEQFKGVAIDGADHSDDVNNDDDQNQNNDDDDQNNDNHDDQNQNNDDQNQNNDDQLTPAQKKEAEDKAEAEKLAAMSPEEKDKYLAEKDKTVASAAAAEKPKPFEEELVARFGGKYKSFEEIEEALNKPAEVSYADDTVRFFNEYVKNGGKIDNEYLESITTNYDAINDGVELLMRQMKAADPKYKTWSDEELEYEIRDKYKMDEWSEDGEEVNDVRRIFSAKMEREANEGRAFLKKKQEELKYIKPEDPEVTKKVAQEREAAQQKWETEHVPKILATVSKLSVPLLDKDGKKTVGTFDYAFDAKDLAEVGQVMKSMGKSVKAFWDQFTDKDGNFNQGELALMMLAKRALNKTVNLAREQGRTAGAEDEHRNITNATFNKGDKRSAAAANTSWDDAAAQSVRENT